MRHSRVASSGHYGRGRRPQYDDDEDGERHYHGRGRGRSEYGGDRGDRGDRSDRSGRGDRTDRGGRERPRGAFHRRRLYADAPDMADLLEKMGKIVKPVLIAKTNKADIKEGKPYGVYDVEIVSEEEAKDQLEGYFDQPINEPEGVKSVRLSVIIALPCLKVFANRDREGPYRIMSRISPIDSENVDEVSQEDVPPAEEEIKA